MQKILPSIFAIRPLALSPPICPASAAANHSGARRQAQDDEVEPPAGLTIEAHGGFDGFYKAGQWVPLTIELANDGPSVEGVIRVSTGRSSNNNEVVYDSPISLPTQSRKRITTFVYFTGFTSRLSLQLLNGNDVIATATITNLTQINADSMLYGILTEDPGELEFLERVVGDRASGEVSFIYAG